VHGATSVPCTSSQMSAGTHTIKLFFVDLDPVASVLNFTVTTPNVCTAPTQTQTTITWATPAPIPYGTPLSATQLDASSGGVSGAFVYTPAAGTVLPVGVHPLSVAFTPSDPAAYTSATGSVQLTVNKATPTITWATPAPIVYGTALSGTQLNATSGGVAGTFAYIPAAGAVLQAGVHTLSVTFTPTDTADYNPSTATVQLTVSQATPAIAWATPAPIVYGTALSATQLNATSGVVAGSFVYSPLAGVVLQAGVHTLAVTFTPTDTQDYSIATASVQLTVNKATPAITWATPAAIMYGTPLSGAQLNASSNVAGTFAYSPTAGSVLAAGVQTLSATFTPSDGVDYATATASVQLTVNKVTSTIAWATPAPIVYGTPLGAAQLDASSTVAGSFLYTPAAGSVLAAGPQTLSVVFTPTDTVDYTTATAAVQLTVNKAPVTVGLTASSASVPAGTPFTLTATVLSSTTGVPIGTVTFLKGASVLGTATLANGVATFPASLLALGSNTVTAAFSGDVDFLAGNSNPVSIAVLPAATTTTLSATPNPVAFGAMATFSVSVTSLAGTPAGSISFFDGTAPIGSATLASGAVTISTATLAVGVHAISAAYSGATAFAPSTSNVVAETVSDFSISAMPGSGTVYTGEAGTYNIVVGSDSGFDLPIALSCSGVLVNTTCSFSPASIAGTGASTLIVQTYAPSQATTASRLPVGYRYTALAGLLLFLLPRRLRKYRRGWPLILMILTLLASGAAMTGCSNPQTLTAGTPLGTQTITVTGTATSGSRTLSHQTTVTLNVKSLF